MPDLIKRTTLMVRDAERAKAWYADVLGMTPYLDTPFVLSGLGLAAGEEGDKTRLVIMKCQDDVVGMIGLLEWIEPRRPPPQEELPTRIPFGMPVFVVQSDDAAATCERARAAGSRIHCEPRDWSTEGAGGARIDMIGVSFFDLDGYFFEVNQRVAR